MLNILELNVEYEINADMQVYILQTVFILFHGVVWYCNARTSHTAHTDPNTQSNIQEPLSMRVFATANYLRTFSEKAVGKINIEMKISYS